MFFSQFSRHLVSVISERRHVPAIKVSQLTEQLKVAPISKVPRNPKSMIELREGGWVTEQLCFSEAQHTAAALPRRWPGLADRPEPRESGTSYR